MKPHPGDSIQCARFFSFRKAIYLCYQIDSSIPKDTSILEDSNLIIKDMQLHNQGVHSEASCAAAANAIRDALYVIGGKWKLPILMTLAGGPQRFRELQKALHGITPKVLSKELKELELNEFVKRTVHPTTPVTVEYSLTPYSSSLQNVLIELRDWGFAHRQRLKASLKASKTQPAPEEEGQKRTIAVLAEK